MSIRIDFMVILGLCGLGRHGRFSREIRHRAWPMGAEGFHGPP